MTRGPFRSTLHALTLHGRYLAPGPRPLAPENVVPDDISRRPLPPTPAHPSPGVLSYYRAHYGRKGSALYKLFTSSSQKEASAGIVPVRTRLSEIRRGGLDSPCTFRSRAPSFEMSFPSSSAQPTTSSRSAPRHHYRPWFPPKNVARGLYFPSAFTPWPWPLSQLIRVHRWRRPFPSHLIRAHLPTSACLRGKAVRPSRSTLPRSHAPRPFPRRGLLAHFCAPPPRAISAPGGSYAPSRIFALFALFGRPLRARPAYRALARRTRREEP